MRSKIMSVLIVLLSVLILLGIGLTVYMLFHSDELKPDHSTSAELFATTDRDLKEELCMLSAYFKAT